MYFEFHISTLILMGILCFVIGLWSAYLLSAL